MSQFKAELVKMDGHDMWDVRISKSGEFWAFYSGYTGPDAAKARERALDRAKSRLEETQRKLIRAQAEAIAAREIMEAVEQMDMNTSVPRGWNKVET